MLRMTGQRTVFSAILLAAIAVSITPALCGPKGAPKAPKPKPPKPAASAVAQPNAKVYGMSLQQWLTAYWIWNYTSDTSKPFQPGPAPVVFMPMPAGELQNPDAAGTANDPSIWKGTLEVTLPPGTGFVLPFFAWLTERYQGYPEVPDDLFIADEEIPNTIMDPVVTLDGAPLLRNFYDYYVGPTMFAEPIQHELSSYGSVSWLGFQGVGVVVRPLTPGTHVLHLTERLRLDQENLPTLPPDQSIGQIYDNTWIINVVPPGKMK